MMKIKTTNIRPVRLDAQCDQCGGVMKHNEVALLTFPAQYRYTCGGCGREETATGDYPRIEWRDAPDED